MEHLTETFMKQVSDASYDLNALVQIKHDIDSERVHLKQIMDKLTHDKHHESVKHFTTRDRSKIIARLCEVKVQRRYVHDVEQKLRLELKVLNSATFNRRIGFDVAFVAAAEILLDEEKFLEIEAKAMLLLKAKKSNHKTRKRK